MANCDKCKKTFDYLELQVYDNLLLCQECLEKEKTEKTLSNNFMDYDEYEMW